MPQRTPKRGRRAKVATIVKETEALHPSFEKPKRGRLPKVATVVKETEDINPSVEKPKRGRPAKVATADVSPGVEAQKREEAEGGRQDFGASRIS